jgi:transcription elongation factor Elf1
MNIRRDCWGAMMEYEYEFHEQAKQAVKKWTTTFVCPRCDFRGHYYDVYKLPGKTVNRVFWSCSDCGVSIEIDVPYKLL